MSDKKNISKEPISVAESLAKQANDLSDALNHIKFLSRARAITVGTSFGGVVEISMSTQDGRTPWCALQPVEVIELIHQLSASVGCHIAIKPREDFSSWREWRISNAEKKHLNGHIPFVNDMAPFQQLGASGFNQEEAEQLMGEWLNQEEYEYVDGAARYKNTSNLSLQGPNEESNKLKEEKNEKAVAAKKPRNKRTTKQSSTPS